MPANYDVTLLNSDLSALYGSYLDHRITRDEYLAAHEARLKLEVGRNADDLEALRTIMYGHVRCSREGEMIVAAIEACAKEHGLVLCDCCHAVLEGDDHIEIESGNGETLRFCHAGCAAGEGWHGTPNNSWVHEDGPEVICASNGTWFADEEEARGAGYERCRECGEWFDYRNGYHRICIDDEFYCSNSCAHSAGYEYCERCEEWVHSTYMNDVVVDEYGGRARWCDGCLDYDVHTCYHCDVLVIDEVAVWDDDAEEYYCPSCASRYLPRGLHSYGYTPELRFRGDSKNSPYLGVELETDGGSDRCSYVNALGDIDKFNAHFYMTQDSSLNNGVEITSHPMTLAYHANDLYEMYETIRSTALQYGFQSHNGGRCGLHVHVNRDFFGKGIDSQDVGGYKMMRLLQRFESNFTKFSRRRDNGWCEYYTYNTYGPDEQGEPDDISRVIEKAKDMKRERKHEQALNFQHDATYEFRIFRGTLNLSTFFACLGMVNGLAHVAKMHSAHYAETVEWSELMRDVVKACDEPKSREFLREYLEAKELL